MAILEDRKGKEYDAFKEEYVTTTTELSAKPLPEITEKAAIDTLENSIYGEQWQEITERAVYAPTRFEYFAGLALQGLVTGTAPKELKIAVRKALELATEMEASLDSKEGG